jgi:hypothetical protein
MTATFDIRKIVIQTAAGATSITRYHSSSLFRDRRENTRRGDLSRAVLPVG